MEFKKAVKAQQKLRLAIDGVSGSGKTYTALAVASGMVGTIAVIDSEHGSSELYADRFGFDVLKLNDFEIEDYIEALGAAAQNGYAIVIIDSTSHAWDALVARVERIANQRFGGNTFRAWGEGTPLQKKLIEAMLSYPGHIIATCRSKTEYSVDKMDSGKTTVRKVGTAAVQRQGFEYEFTMALTMDANHVGFVSKDRTGKFQDKWIEKPGSDFGKELIAWLNEGAVDYEALCKAKMKEIGNVLMSVFEDNSPIFAPTEVDEVREALRALKTPWEQRLPVIERMLAKQKEILQARIEAPPADTDAEEVDDPFGDPPPAPTMEKPATAQTAVSGANVNNGAASAPTIAESTTAPSAELSASGKSVQSDATQHPPTLGTSHTADPIGSAPENPTPAPPAQGQASIAATTETPATPLVSERTISAQGVAPVATAQTQTPVERPRVEPGYMTPRPVPPQQAVFEDDIPYSEGESLTGALKKRRAARAPQPASGFLPGDDIF